MAPTKRRSTRQAATRKRSIYLDPETDDDFEADSEDDFQPEPQAEVAQQEPARKKRKTAHRKPQTRSKAAKTKQTSLKRVLKIGKPLKPRSDIVKKTVFDGPSDHKIPRWTDLPIDILRQIFIYAATPFHDYTRECSVNASWLMGSARTCRAFAAPALEAYYSSPAFYNDHHPHHFLDLLQMPNDKRFMNYNVKVQSLYMDVRTLKPTFDLCQLLSEMPQLQHMELLHPQYMPPYRPMKSHRCTVPTRDVVRTMEASDIRLRSWRWSREMMPEKQPLDLYSALSTVHTSHAFAYLKRLVVTGFNVEDSLEPQQPAPDDASQETALIPGLATSIAQLPSLTDLTFISCDAIMEKFLQRLPTNLQRLELSNCLEITSDMLRDFFNTSGLQLRELVLNNNAALNLSFTQSLKDKCPRLEVLKLDLHYYSEKFVVNDAEALYDELLPEDEIPTWPTTLQHLEIVHAQKWSPEAAQNLFRSLIDSAEDLSRLRTLIIQAHINIPWRDRVGFRDQWIERLRRVYLRSYEDPSPNLGSLKQFRLSQPPRNKDPLPSSSVDELAREVSDDDMPIRSRKVLHVQASPHHPSGDTEYYSDSESAAPSSKQPMRRSKRVAENQILTRSKTTTPSPESDSESDDESDEGDAAWQQTAEKFIQGLCDVVKIVIDNQRPRETVWTEGDFLDSEVSGDDDWQEGADDDQEEAYAW